MTNQHICVMEVGYIGLPTACTFAAKGVRVTGVDTNPTVVATLSEGKLYIHEPGQIETVRQALDTGKMSVCNHVVPADAFIIAVPLGALLSGGTDSAVVVAILSQLVGSPIKTFTVGFTDGGSVNESDEARQTARLFGTEHHEILIDHVDYKDFLFKVIWHMDEPLSTTSVLAMYSVCQLAHQHVTVVLTGQGADELFAGYYRYMGERYGYLYRMLPDGFRHSVVMPIITKVRRGERYKRAVRSLDICEPDQRFMDIYAVFPEKLKHAIYGNKRSPDNTGVIDIIKQWRQGVDYLDTLSQMTYVDARLSLADDLLLYGDKMSMAASIEARVPFLDTELMKVAESLPARWRIRGLTCKYIHKKVVAKWLPEQIIQRPKKGFEIPVDRWFQREMQGYVSDMLLGKSSAALHYFDRDTIKGMLTAHAEGREDFQRQLFSLLTFEVWHRVFIDRRVSI